VETRRTGGGGRPLEAFFPANAGGVYTVGGGAFFAAVDPRKERNIAPVDDTSTSPNFYPHPIATTVSMTNKERGRERQAQMNGRQRHIRFTNDDEDEDELSSPFVVRVCSCLRLSALQVDY